MIESIFYYYMISIDAYIDTSSPPVYDTGYKTII